MDSVADPKLKSALLNPPSEILVSIVDHLVGNKTIHIDYVTGPNNTYVLQHSICQATVSENGRLQCDQVGPASSQWGD